MDEQAIPYPPGVESLNRHSLEDYINARNIQFARVFVNRCGLNMTQAEFEELVRQSLALIPVPPPSASGGEYLQLVFRHECMSLGCLDPQCTLCENNPNRRCDTNFAPKYLVHDILKAKCRACIRVEVVDRHTGKLRQDPILDRIKLEMCILDGHCYDAKCLDVGQESDEDLESCRLLVNNKGQQLLQAGPSGTHTTDKKVHVALKGGWALLPDLHVSDSSEALLSGRKPPFRLFVKALGADGGPLPGGLHINHAVSESFVLATRRTRTAGKAEVPNVDDHVSKLEHMGRETVRKLKDLGAAAEAANVELDLSSGKVPECVETVGEFRKLVLVAESDSYLRQRLQQTLKLTKEKWEEARDHALRAVIADNFLRVWYSDDNMSIGVLFPCRNGEIDLERPVGLLQKKDTLPGSDPQYEVILLHQQTPAQRQQVRQLQRAAVQNWWRAGHVGWAIFPVNSEYLQSETKGESDAAEEQDQATSMGQYGAMANQVGADGRALAPSPFADIAQETVSLTPNCAATASASGLQITSAQQISKIGSFSSAQGGEPHSSGQMLGMNSGSGQHLGAVEGRNEPFYDIPSSEFLQATNNILSAQDSAAALSLSQFPSAGAYQGGDGTGRSGSLRWQMDQLRGMDSLDFGGSGIDISKLESIELPQELAAYANFSPADANLGNGMGGSGFGNALFGQGSDLVRQSSGLESMQSIEHALPSVPPSTSANYTDILEAAARDFNQSQQPSQHGGGASG